MKSVNKPVVIPHCVCHFSPQFSTESTLGPFPPQTAKNSNISFLFHEYKNIFYFLNKFYFWVVFILFLRCQIYSLLYEASVNIQKQSQRFSRHGDSEVAALWTVTHRAIARQDFVACNMTGNCVISPGLLITYSDLLRLYFLLLT
jgi:hypothetical protein